MKKLAFLLLTSLAVRVSSVAQDPCAIIWDPAVLLSDTNYNTNSPKIALSGDDTIHVTWQNASHTIRLPYVRSTDGGSTFSPQRELLIDSLAFPGRATWNHIVAWRNRVYAFFVGSSAGDSPVRMLLSTNGGSDWSGVVDISPDTCGIIQDVGIHGDTLAIVYPPPPLARKILRSTNGGETWTRTNENLTDFAHLALSSGVLHLAQVGVVGNTGEIEYRRSTDLGDTWTQRMFLSTSGGGNSLDPTAATGGETNDSLIIAAWRDPKYGCLGGVGCSIIARRGVVGGDSTTWFTEQLLTDVPLGYLPSLSINKSRFAAAWLMDQTIAPYAHVSVSHDTSWCPRFDPTASPTRRVVTVDVALSSKGVHVVWDASQAPSPSTFRIFYRRGRFIETDVKEEPGTLPPYAHLEQNYPNPFNPATKIQFSVGTSGHTSLRVFDILGHEVATLVDENKNVGEYTIEWKTEGLPTGVYFYRLVAGTTVETKKAIIIR
jgi:hypothetical protein